MSSVWKNGGASLYFHYNGIHNQRMYTYYIGKLKSTRIKKLINIDISCLLEFASFVNTNPRYFENLDNGGLN
jgi:hypothetical protein